MYKDKTKERLYRVWNNIKKRCYEPTNNHYKRYGGRGIKLCDEWLTFDNFYNWAIQSGYKVELLKNNKNKWSIDRIDNNGNYEPTNCRWVDFITQQYNKEKTIYLIYDNRRYNLLELSNQLGINKYCLKSRIKRSWDIDKLNKPIIEKNKEKVIYNGKKYTYAELAKLTNNTTKNIYRRIAILGWSVEDAISLPSCKYSTKIKTFEYKGKQMTITDIAKDLGIGRTTLQYRLQQCNYDLQKVLENKNWRK